MTTEGSAKFRFSPTYDAGSCLYGDDPMHEDVCYICAPRWMLVWWDIKYRVDRIVRWLRGRR